MALSLGGEMTAQAAPVSFFSGANGATTTVGRWLQTVTGFGFFYVHRNAKCVPFENSSAYLHPYYIWFHMNMLHLGWLHADCWFPMFVFSHLGSRHLCIIGSLLLAPAHHILRSITWGLISRVFWIEREIRHYHMSIFISHLQMSISPPNSPLSKNSPTTEQQPEVKLKRVIDMAKDRITSEATSLGSLLGFFYEMKVEDLPILNSFS